MIIALCILLLFAYLFDISSSKTKIPTVILLLALGYAAKEATVFFDIKVPNLSPVLPLLGTLGLILIVFEGSLELKISKKKLPSILQSSVIALLPFAIFCVGLAYFITQTTSFSFKAALTNAIPLGIISSAIAISSSSNFNQTSKDFITYESTLSDIYGVIFFNFFALNEIINGHTIGHFFIQIAIILGITFITTIGLTILLNKIKHHVKFIPIILMVILIYFIAKEFHLPALIFILIFGLFLGNLEQLKRFNFLQKLQPETLSKEVYKFKDIVVEIVFLIRSLFFLLFGFLIQQEELLNTNTILLALAITVFIFLTRYIFLLLFKLPIKPLLYIAPRGLITILLFLSIPDSQLIPIINRSLVIQVIILTALVIMIGTITDKGTPEETPPEYI